MGGRGKTPLVALVARLLLAAGERPAILSRGYARRIREDGVVIVSDGVHLRADLDRSGDEPMMLARAVPGAAVLVCEQRAIAAAMAEHVLGATVAVLDDGFQHRSMRRDLDLVAIAPGDLADRRFPFGRLRDSPRALRKADAVIVDGALDKIDRSHWQCPTFAMTRHLGEPQAIDPAQPLPPRGAPVVALAGIAGPERFSRALETAGWTVAALVSFRDHHQYTPADLDRVTRAMRETGAAGILTTDKDAVRLRPLRPLPAPIAAVPLTVTLDRQLEFESWLLESVRQIRVRLSATSRKRIRAEAVGVSR
jgi:tetraacyldisaccharide 4'-kinase